MGIDAGFDMVPQLSQDAEDAAQWELFFNLVRMAYEHDEQVTFDGEWLIFKAGEHPAIPLHGHRFLRFSSKVSGAIAAQTGVEQYIRSVTRIASKVFGSRIHVWDEGRDESGHYSWDVVRSVAKAPIHCAEQQRVADAAVVPSEVPQEALESIGSPLYEVKNLAGKGRALVAGKFIQKGARIISEKPLILVPSTSPDQLHLEIAAMLKDLTEHQRRQYLSLHNNFPGKNTFSGIARTNALPCGSGSSDGGVYATLSLINHSCFPNAHNNWNPELQHETIHAIRDIQPGEEITISYSEGTQQARQQKLTQSFGFECHCEVCTLPEQNLRESDSRRNTIATLDDAIGNPFAMMRDPAGSLHKCHLLLETINEEFTGGAGALLARVYYDAFQISIAHGDQARAAVFAERAYEARVICEGDDSPATQKMKELMMAPASHASFEAYSRRWKSKRGTRPKAVKADAFESWLWKDV